jgi:hypothetical protein
MALIAFVLAGVAFARQAARSDRVTPAAALRAVVDHYRLVAWTFERAARRPLAPTDYTYRRSTDPAYLQWTIDTWQRRADAARRAALTRIDRRLAVALPAPPLLHSRLSLRIAYSRRLTLKLQSIYPGKAARSLASAAGPVGGAAATLHAWEDRSAAAALAVARHAVATPTVPPALRTDFSCIHGYEGSWTANTGNGYYGGLQMDLPFQRRYGSDYLRRWGTADHWPVWAQVAAAVRAYRSGRGFFPWPNTARACGLI